MDSYGIVDSDQDLSVVFEKFLTSIQDFNDSKARRTQGNIKYNHNHIEKHLKYVEKERLKLTDLQSHIEYDLLKPLISRSRCFVTQHSKSQNPNFFIEENSIVPMKIAKCQFYVLFSYLLTLKT